MENLKKYKKAWKLWEDWVFGYNNIDGSDCDVDVYEGCRVIASEFADAPRQVISFNLPFSMLYGLLLEFLDEQGVYIDMERYYHDGNIFLFSIYDMCSCKKYDSNNEGYDYAERALAQLAAVEKAFGILEERLGS